MNNGEYPQFFTATVLEWRHLLRKDTFKKIILDCLDFLVLNERVTIYAFVIMPNHLHLIWQCNKNHTAQKVQQSFLRFTAQQMKFELMKTNPDYLNGFKVDAKDREYQFWERNPLSINLFTHQVFEQKLEYIHNNPIQDKWRLCTYPEDYEWSSAKFYITGKKDFSFLRHYVDGEA